MEGQHVPFVSGVIGFILLAAIALYHAYAGGVEAGTVVTPTTENYRGL